jgi:hypothetical protein
MENKNRTRRFDRAREIHWKNGSIFYYWTYNYVGTLSPIKRERNIFRDKFPNGKTLNDNERD